jgi:hypothetical protein
MPVYAVFFLPLSASENGRRSPLGSYSVRSSAAVFTLCPSQERMPAGLPRHYSSRTYAAAMKEWCGICQSILHMMAEGQGFGCGTILNQVEGT